MAGIDKAEVAKALTDLLTIAKVAMPEGLFAIDPRVLRAQELLDRLKTGKSSAAVLGVPPISPAGRRPPYKGE